MCLHPSSFSVYFSLSFAVFDLSFHGYLLNIKLRKRHLYFTLKFDIFDESFVGKNNSVCQK